MAKKAPVTTDGDAAADAAPQKSFRELAQETADRDATRIEELARVVSDAPTAAPAAKTDEKPADEPDEETAYKTWFEAQPENYRTKFATNVVQWQSAQLGEFYGPEVSAVLEDIRKDPELKKKVSRLTDKQFREYLFNTAAEIYDDPRFGRPVAGDAEIPVDPATRALTEKVEQLEQKETQRIHQQYLDSRQNEYGALLNTFPELRFEKATDKVGKRVAAIIDTAEERSQKAGKKISYADVYTEMKAMWDDQAGNPAPRGIPATSPTEIPKPQAPRTKVDARANIDATLQKHGSLSNLARALRS